MKFTKEANIEELKLLKDKLQSKVKKRDKFLWIGFDYFYRSPILGTIYKLFTLPVDVVYNIKNMSDEKKIKKINEILKQQPVTKVKVKRIYKSYKQK